MDWMDPVWWLDRFGELLLAEPGHHLHRVRPVLPVPARATPCCSRWACSSPPAHRHLPRPGRLELLIALAAVTVAAFLGNVIGYEIGRAIGPPLYERDGRILKRKYFDQTEAFFDKHGNKALVIGRFVPFVRTYITVVAGVTRMERRRFFIWSAVGAVLWVLSITLLGYFLGRTFPSLGENIDKAILVILAFSVIPWPTSGGGTGVRRVPRPTTTTTTACPTATSPARAPSPGRARHGYWRRPAPPWSAPHGPRGRRRRAGSRPPGCGRSRRPRPRRRHRPHATPWSRRVRRRRW